MQRRELLAGIATATTAGLAGCGVLGGSCGPGETAIEDLKQYVGDEYAPQVRGSVTSVTQSEGIFTIDDGTDKAIVFGGPPYPDEGQCMVVEGEIQQCVGCDDNVEYEIVAFSYRPAGE